jgi:hypothetical protein
MIERLDGLQVGTAAKSPPNASGASAHRLCCAANRVAIERDTIVRTTQIKTSLSVKSARRSDSIGPIADSASLDLARPLTGDGKRQREDEFMAWQRFEPFEPLTTAIVSLACICLTTLPASGLAASLAIAANTVTISRATALSPSLTHSSRHSRLRRRHRSTVSSATSHELEQAKFSERFQSFLSSEIRVENCTSITAAQVRKEVANGLKRIRNVNPYLVSEIEQGISSWKIQCGALSFCQSPGCGAAGAVTQGNQTWFNEARYPQPITAMPALFHEFLHAAGMRSHTPEESSAHNTVGFLISTVAGFRMAVENDPAYSCAWVGAGLPPDLMVSPNYESMKQTCSSASIEKGFSEQVVDYRRWLSNQRELAPPQI